MPKKNAIKRFIFNILKSDILQKHPNIWMLIQKIGFYPCGFFFRVAGAPHLRPALPASQAVLVFSN